MKAERMAELRWMLCSGRVGAPEIVGELLDSMEATAAALELGRGDILADRAEEVMDLLKQERAVRDRHFAEVVSLRGDKALFEDTVLRELEATRTERDHLRQRFADLHNKHRHEFYDTVENATEKLFQAMSFHRNTKGAA